MPSLEFVPEEDLPPVTTEAFGPVTIERLTIGGMSDLDGQGAQDADPAKLAELMITQLCHKADGTRLTEGEVSALSPADRAVLVQGLIDANEDLFGDPVTERGEDENGHTKIRKTGVRITMPRGESESAESYLHRGWQAQLGRLKAQVEAMLPAISGMRDTIRTAVMPDLIKNVSAAARLGQQLKGLSSLGASVGTGLIKTPGLGAPPFSMPREPTAPRPTIEPLKNPAVKTNVLLSEVKVELEQMRAVAALTAEMQQTLNDVARTILTEFSKGAEDAAKTSENSLKMAELGIRFAKRSYWVAIASMIVSTVVALVALWTSIDASGKRTNEQTQSAARLEAARNAEIHSRDELTRALDRHSRALEAQAKRHGRSSNTARR